MDTLTTLDNVMRTFFLPTIPEIMNYDVDLYGEIEKSGKNLKGADTVEIPLQTALNERGVGARPEGGILPTAGNMVFEKATASIVYLYGVLSMTGQTMRLKGENMKIVELKRAMSGLMNAFKFDMNRQIWGDGSGVMGIVAAGGVGANALTMDVPYKAQYFKKGQFIDTWSGNTLHGDSLEITDVDFINGILAMSATTSVVAADYVYREDNKDHTTPFSVFELTGLGAMVSNSNTYEGIIRSTHNFWQSVIHTAVSARDLDEPLISAWLDDIAAISGDLPDIIYAGNGIRRAYVKALNAMHQPIESMPTKMGFNSGLKFVYGGKEIPIVSSRFAIANQLTAVRLQDIWLAEGYPLDWDSIDGKILQKRETTDTVWARLSYGVQLCSDNPAVTGALKMLNEY